MSSKLTKKQSQPNASEIAPEPRTDSDRELLFKYYIQQWEQIRHCENMRSAFSLQLLTVAGGSVAGFFYFRGCGGFQLLLAAVVITIGILGLLVVRALAKAANVHVWRARAVRKLIPSIDLIASKHRGFIPISTYFLLLNGLILVFGLLLAVFALHGIPSNVTMTSFLRCAPR